MDLTVYPVGTVICDIHLPGNKSFFQHGKPFAPKSAGTHPKNWLRFAGLQANGTTPVAECLSARNHTKRVMRTSGFSADGQDQTIRVTGRQIPKRLDIGIPGDISYGAFWMALAAPLVRSRMILRHIDLNPCRLGFVDTLLRMGVAIREEVISCDEGEWFGNLDIRGRQLRPIQIGLKEVPSLMDEIPLLAVLAAKAKGVSTIRGASALRFKETDRTAAIVTNLKKMDVGVEEFSDGLAICGTGRLRGAEMDSFGDHRIAMAFVIAGLLAEENETVIHNAECIAVSYPSFQADLLKLMEMSSHMLVE